MRSKLLTIREAAALFGISQVTIQRWIHQGKIPFRVQGDSYVFKRSELKAWAASHDLQLRDSRSAQLDSPHQNTLLADTLQKCGIIRSVEGNDVYTVFENALARLDFLSDSLRKELHDQLLQREELAPTGLGRGVAIPHSRTRLDLGITESRVCLILLDQPVDFNAVDGEPVDTLFMLFTVDTKSHLKILSLISHILSNETVHSLLRDPAATDMQILDALREAEQS